MTVVDLALTERFSPEIAFEVADEHLRYRLADGWCLRMILVEIGAECPMHPREDDVILALVAYWRRLAAVRCEAA